VDAAVLEVTGLVRDQGWLADRALEMVLRREKLWAAERRAAAEAAYGLVRWGRQLEWLLGEAGRDRVPPQLLYALWLARFGGLEPLAAARRLAVPLRALAGLEGAEGRIAAIEDPVERLSIEESLPRWMADRLAGELGLPEARALARALRSLLRNAVQASPPGSPVELWLSADDREVRLAPDDRRDVRLQPDVGVAPGLNPRVRLKPDTTPVFSSGNPSSTRSYVVSGFSRTVI